MKRNSLIVSVLILCGLAAWIAYPVLAHCGKCAADAKKIAQLIQSSKVTLAKAVESAEASTKGKAVSVTPAMNEAGKLTLQVFCITGEKLQRCDVDGATGVAGKVEAVDHFPIFEKDHTHGPAGSAALNITNKAVELGCGNCVYHISGVKTCELAAKIDGKTYMVKGQHGLNPHNFCDEGKPATVTGTLQGETLIVTTVKLDG